MIGKEIMRLGYFAEKSKRNKGSLTVEAAIALPVFICVVMSLVLLMRIIYVHSIIQHAITQTADELATYSYIYSVTGVQKLHDQAVDYLDQNKETFENHAGEIVEAYGSLSDTGKALGDAAANPQDADLEQISQMLSDSSSQAEKLAGVITEAAKDPKKELMSLVCAFARAGMEDAKAILAEPLIRLVIGKYLRTGDISDADKRLLGLQIEGGFNGLDFKSSRFFSDKRSIDITVKYRMKNILPIRFLPEICIVQRASVRAWLDGTGAFAAPEEKQETQASLWDLPPMERGRQIEQQLKANLPEQFPVLDNFSGGTASVYASLNLDDASYQKSSNVKSKVRGYINKLAEFNGAKYGNTQINAKDITSKELILIIPQMDVDEKVQKALDECVKYALSKNIKLTIRKDFGRRTEPAG